MYRFGVIQVLSIYVTWLLLEVVYVTRLLYINVSLHRNCLSTEGLNVTRSFTYTCMWSSVNWAVQTCVRRSLEGLKVEVMSLEVRTVEMMSLYKLVDTDSRVDKAR